MNVTGLILGLILVVSLFVIVKKPDATKFHNTLRLKRDRNLGNDITSYAIENLTLKAIELENRLEAVELRLGLESSRDARPKVAA